MSDLSDADKGCPWFVMDCFEWEGKVRLTKPRRDRRFRQVQRSFTRIR